jgi:DNA-binding MarR family transcriptional regulator
MQRRYDHIIELISLWQEFEEQRSTSADYYLAEPLLEFQQWLGERLHGLGVAVSTDSLTIDNAAPQEYSAEASTMLLSLADEGAEESTTNTTAQQAPPAYAADLAMETRISVLIGRMGRFAKFYVKKALDGQPISTLDEFTFLATIRRAGTPTKTEVCVENITEITTGTEILRRMIKSGFVEEFTDEKDRRVKRLTLTPAGAQALYASFAQLRDVARIVAGRLTDEQKQQMMTMLDSLDHFHTDIYSEQRSESIASMVTRNLETRIQPA